MPAAPGGTSSDLEAEGAAADWLGETVGFVQGRALGFGITDPECPVVEGVQLHGGCTDAEGRTWWGEASWDPEYGGSTAGFGHDREDGCWELRTAEVSIEGSGGGTGRGFSVAIWTVCDGETTALWAADGGSSSSYDVDLDDFVANEKVRVGSTALGVADLRESGQFWRTCGSEPDTGTVSVKSGSHELAYTYDGVSVCDGLVPVTLDGVALEGADFP